MQTRKPPKTSESDLTFADAQGVEPSHSVCFSDHLDKQLEPYRAENREIMRNWFASETFGVTYPALMVETYHYVKHHCALMERAYGRLEKTRRPLRAYLEKHIDEEKGHEEWALNDLTRLGYDAKEVKRSMPLSETISLIGGQIYIIDYVNPVGFFGYMYFTEATPPTDKFLRVIAERFAINPKAMTFLAGHAESDIAHSIKLRAVLNNYIGNDFEQTAALMSATMGHSTFNRLLVRLQSGQFIRPLPLLMERRNH